MRGDDKEEAAYLQEFERYWDEYQRPWLPNGIAGYEHAKKAWRAAAIAVRNSHANRSPEIYVRNRKLLSSEFEITKGGRVIILVDHE